MYSRPYQCQIIRWNLSRSLANLTLTTHRAYVAKAQDDFKILQVSERRKNQRDFLPGVEHRKELLKEWNESSSLYQNENEAISTDIDPEEFNAMRADFMDLDKSYELHKREKLLRRNAKVKSQVRKKHFKEAKEPKFLTVTEMYQINLLNKQDPVTWTPEKLSQSFPATPRVILKVLSSSAPKSPERMLQHDMDAKQNWSLLQAGKLVGLSPDYERHLSMFSYRDPVVRTIKEYKTFQPPVVKYVPESTEFRSIITSYYDLVKTKKRVRAADPSPIGDNSNAPRLIKSAQKLIANERSENKGPNNEEGGRGMSEYRRVGMETSRNDANDSRELSGKRFEKAERRLNQLGRTEGQRVLGSTYGQTVGRKQSETTPAGNAFVRWFSSDSSHRESSSDSTLEKQDVIKTPDEEKFHEMPGDSDKTFEKPNTHSDEANTLEASTETPRNLGHTENPQGLHDVRDTEIPRDVSDEVPSNFDRNRTMHSRKPAHWEQLERQRQQEQRNEERVRADVKQTLADSSSHDGKWRRLKPSTGFTGGYQEDDVDLHNSQGYQRGRLDRDRMDLERIRRNRASILYDEEEEAFPEERYERDDRFSRGRRDKRSNSYRASNMFEEEEEVLQEEDYEGHERQRSLRNARGRTVDSCYEDSGAEENQRSKDTDVFLDRINRRSDVQDERGDERESRLENARVQQYREETAASADNMTQHGENTDSQGPGSGVTDSGTFDVNKRMYPRKPAYWDEINRQRHREEKERQRDVRAINEAMENRSMYDGKWRRLRPRTPILRDRPEDSRARVVPLDTRRMDTLHGVEEDDDEDAIHVNK